MTTPQDCGRQGLACIDKVLSERPHKNGEALTAATAALCIYRDELISRAPSGGEDARRRLEHCNAILSIVAAVHFPLGNAPWEELEKARGWLADLLGDPRSAPAPPRL